MVGDGLENYLIWNDQLFQILQCGIPNFHYTPHLLLRVCEGPYNQIEK